MGAITFSIDQSLLNLLSQHLTLDVFIETGTFRGDTIRIAKPYFNQIFSIELSKHYYDENAKQFADDETVNLMHGDSAEALATILPQLNNRPIIFWLDAHWCVADETAGELSQCPLLAELSTILKLNNQSVIIIDDARLFLTTPAKPHETSSWPSFDSLVRQLIALSPTHQLTVLNDCIIFFPAAIEQQMKEFSSEHGVDWLDIYNRCHDSEALLLDVCQENERLHHLDFWQRVRGLVGYVLKQIKMRPRTNVDNTI